MQNLMRVFDIGNKFKSFQEPPFEKTKADLHFVCWLQDQKYVQLRVTKPRPNVVYLTLAL
jgi:hypothetical protein